MLKKLFTSAGVFLAVFIIISIAADLYYHERLTHNEDPTKTKWICHCDFRVFWIASRNMRYQIDENALPPKTSLNEFPVYDKAEKFYHFRYSPFGALAMTPIGMIPSPRAALYAWYVILNTAMLSSLLVLINALCANFNVTRAQRYIVLWATAIVSMRFYLMDLAIGQIDVLIALFFVFFLITYVRGRQLAAGIILALILQFKPLFFPMLFYFFVTGRKKLVLSSITAFSFFLLAPAALIGFDKALVLLKDWREILGMSVPSQLLNYKNQSITYFIGNLLIRNDYLKGLISVKDLFYLIGAALTLLVYIPAARFLKFIKPRDKQKYRYAEISALIIISLLFSPIAWVAHFINLIIPFSVAVLFTLKSKKKKALYFALGAFIVLSCALGTDITNFIPVINKFHGINISVGTFFLAYALFSSYKKSAV